MKPARQDLAGGLALIALGAFALWQGAELSAGSLRQIGPGFVPRVLAAGTALCGIALVASALAGRGAMMERWGVRGNFFVLAAILAFGITVRPLGLVVAGPLTVAISVFATRETRWAEAAVYGAALVAFCIVLFKFLLRLPVPLAPWAVGY